MRPGPMAHGATMAGQSQKWRVISDKFISFFNAVLRLVARASELSEPGAVNGGVQIPSRRRQGATVNNDWRLRIFAELSKTLAIMTCAMRVDHCESQRRDPAVGGVDGVDSVDGVSWQPGPRTAVPELEWLRSIIQQHCSPGRFRLSRVQKAPHIKKVENY